MRVFVAKDIYGTFLYEKQPELIDTYNKGRIEKGWSGTVCDFTVNVNNEILSLIGEVEMNTYIEVELEISVKRL